jgi:poly(A) polymerase
VVLDKKNGSCRLVKKDKDKDWIFDFTDFRGKNLAEDLFHRDFSINSLALDLASAVAVKDLDDFIIDLYGARDDLEDKLIRIVNKNAFDDDPLRLLRAFSLSCVLGFAIEQKTIALIKDKRKKLASVSGERIREELFKLLQSSQAYHYFKQLDRLKILGLIMPEIEVMRGVSQGPYHHLDVFKHSLETLRQLEMIIQEQARKRDIRIYLDEVIAGTRKRQGLMKLAAFLHDLGKPLARQRKGKKIRFYGHERIGAKISSEISRRLKLANDEGDALRRMVFWHLRPGYLGDSQRPTQRATFRYFRDTQREAVSTLMLSLADQRATCGPLTSEAARKQHEHVVAGLIKEFFRKAKQKKMVRIINGNDLIKKLHLEPSPLFGKLLAELEELQAIGRIKTKEAGLRIARKLLQQKYA